VASERATRVLAINAGSSSLKSALYTLGDQEKLELRARVERIGEPAGLFRVEDGEGKELLGEETHVPDLRSAIEGWLAWLGTRWSAPAPEVVGHRIVYGGAEYVRPHRITSALIGALEEMTPLDPEHMPQALAAIGAVERSFPSVPQVACFDSAFHRRMPREAQLYAIPRRLSERGIIRYGFHGLSYEYLLQELRREAGDEVADGRIIIAHLGNGASMGAVRGGVGVDTTMGFTPTAGLAMSTRSGDLDPGILVYLLRQESLDASRLNALLNEQSGLLGISGVSSDMKELLDTEARDPHAAEAIAVFCHVAKRFLGALCAVLGGLDTLIFTGGMGENAPRVRQLTCQGLEFLGIDLDSARNEANAAVISRGGSAVTVRVMKTNEELMVARHSRDVLRSGA
jgi:acetate kinase